jgi:hypothetical protein
MYKIQIEMKNTITKILKPHKIDSRLVSGEEMISGVGAR